MASPFKLNATRIRFPLKALLRSRATNAPVFAAVRPMIKSDLREWNKILGEAVRSGGRIECYALYVDAQWNGLLSVDLQGGKTSEGTGLAVDYLATRPSNRRGDLGFKDVGKVFLGLSVYRSRELGWGGRLWLESLSEVESLYEHVGFERLPGKSRDGNAMFELWQAGADNILNDVLATKTLVVSARESKRIRH